MRAWWLHGKEKADAMYSRRSAPAEGARAQVVRTSESSEQRTECQGLRAAPINHNPRPIIATNFLKTLTSPLNMQLYAAVGPSRGRVQGAICCHVRLFRPCAGNFSPSVPFYVHVQCTQPTGQTAALSPRRSCVRCVTFFRTVFGLAYAASPAALNTRRGERRWGHTQHQCSTAHVYRSPSHASVAMGRRWRSSTV